jgi:hypothetical protein
MFQDKTRLIERNFQTFDWRTSDYVYKTKLKKYLM